jgi:hypothetical protein
MTIDVTGLLAQALAGSRYRTTPLPAGLGTTWYPPGFTVDFADDTAMAYDADSSVHIHHEPRSFQSGTGRGLVSPTRDADSAYGDSFDAATLQPYSLLQTSGASADLINLTDADSAVKGWTLELKTQYTNGAIAGIERILPDALNKPIGQTFSCYVLPTLKNGGDSADAAFHFYLQNDHGREIRARYFNGNQSVFYTKAGVTDWHLQMEHGGDYPCEWWHGAKDNGDGTHRFRTFAGTDLVKEEPAVILPTGPTGNNRRLYAVQRSEGQNLRRLWLHAMGVSPDQEPQDTVLCSNPYSLQIVPTRAHFSCMLEDVGGDRLNINPADAGENFTVWASRNDKNNWHKVPVSVIHEWPHGGIIDNPEKQKIVAGYVDFTGPEASTLRFNVKSTKGFMWTMRTASIFCE